MKDPVLEELRKNAEDAVSLWNKNLRHPVTRSVNDYLSIYQRKMSPTVALYVFQYIDRLERELDDLRATQGTTPSMAPTYLVDIHERIVENISRTDPSHDTHPSDSPAAPTFSTDDADDSKHHFGGAGASSNFETQTDCSPSSGGSDCNSNFDTGGGSSSDSGFSSSDP